MNPENLPRDAGVKLEGLRNRCGDRRALLDGVYARLRDCTARHNRLQNLLSTATDEATAKEYAAKLQLANEEHTRLTQSRQQHDAEHRSAARDLTRCEDWVAQQPNGTRLRMSRLRPVKFDPDRLATARADIERLRGEIQRVEGAPLDTASQRAELAQALDQPLASVYLDRSAFGVKVCTRQGTRQLTAIELHWWLADPKQRERLLAKLIPEVADGMTRADKAEALERLRAKLLPAERTEEMFIDAGESMGLFIERRPDADPRAMLGLAPDAEDEAADAA